MTNQKEHKASLNSFMSTMADDSNEFDVIYKSSKTTFTCKALRKKRW